MRFPHMNRMHQNTSGSLALTPGEIEARAQFELIGPVSKVIRDCTPTGVAEEAQWAPNSLHLETTTVAEREESGMIPHHGVRNNCGAAGWRRKKSDAVCCVDEWYEALQRATRFGGSQGSGADAWYVNEPIVQHKDITILHVCRYTASAGDQVGPDGTGTEQATPSEVVCEFDFP